MKSLFDKVSAGCSRLTTKTYSTSFSLGIFFLAQPLRDPIYAVYGFVRFAVGQNSGRHDDVSALVGFIYDNVLDVGSFHKGKRFPDNFNARKGESFRNTETLQRVLANLRLVNSSGSEAKVPISSRTSWSLMAIAR